MHGASTQESFELYMESAAPRKLGEAPAGARLAALSAIP